MTQTVTWRKSRWCIKYL